MRSPGSRSAPRARGALAARIAIAAAAAAGLAAVDGAASAAAAQGLTSARSAVSFERYTLEAGPYEAASQMAVPLTVDMSLGGRAHLTLSAGFLRVELEPDEANGGESQVVSGLLDTEVRVGLDVVRDRVRLLISGALPTGNGSVPFEDVPVLGVTASDLIGFAVADLGGGGKFGGGLVMTVPLGAMAVGGAVVYTHSFPFEPVVDFDTELQPGAELRARAGIEGPIADRTYVRLAGIFARRAQDRIEGDPQSGVGNRFAGYATLTQGVGRGTVSLFLFDVFRADPQLERTAVGTAFVPRGNLLAAGIRASAPLAGSLRFEPRVEYRLSHAASDSEGGEMEQLGSTVRFGADLRHRLTPQFSIAVGGDGLTGSFSEANGSPGISGFRGTFHLEWQP